jgi:hypothetical protein
MQLLHSKQTSGAIFFKVLALLLSFRPPVVFIDGSILQTDKRKKNDEEKKKKKKGKSKQKLNKLLKTRIPPPPAQFLPEKTTLLLSATLLSGGDGYGTQQEQQKEDRENEGTRGLSSKLLPTLHRPTDAGLPSWGWC